LKPKHFFAHISHPIAARWLKHLNISNILSCTPRAWAATSASLVEIGQKRSARYSWRRKSFSTVSSLPLKWGQWSITHFSPCACASVIERKVLFDQ
jgi:hypothetical protein